MKPELRVGSVGDNRFILSCEIGQTIMAHVISPALCSLDPDLPLIAIRLKEQPQFMFLVNKLIFDGMMEMKTHHEKLIGSSSSTGVWLEFASCPILAVKLNPDYIIDGSVPYIELYDGIDVKGAIIQKFFKQSEELTNMNHNTAEMLISQHPIDMISLMNTAFLRLPEDAPIGSADEKSQWAYTVEEFKETQEALSEQQATFLSERSMVLIRDGVGDIFTTLLGWCWRAGIPIARESFDVTCPHGVFAVDHPEIENLWSDFSKCFYMLHGMREMISSRIKDYDSHMLESEYIVIAEHCNYLINLLASFACKIGINYKSDLAKITESNLSKICPDEDSLARTIDSYGAKGIKLVPKRSTVGGYAVFIDGDQIVDGKFYPDAKFMKNVDWFEPELYGGLDIDDRDSYNPI